MVAESCVDLARSFVGIAVKAGAAHPDIATEAALRAALLGARSIAYSRIGASGIFFAQLIERMGIAAEINARARIVSVGPDRRTAGRPARPILAVQQISELKQVAGIEVVGPIPRELQTRRGVFRGPPGGVGEGAAGRRAVEISGLARGRPGAARVRARALNPPVLRS